MKCLIALLVGLLVPIAAEAQTLGTCVVNVGTGSMNIAITGITSGQSLIGFYAGNGSDPGVTDSQSNTWTAPTCSPSVSRASGFAENFRYVLSPAAFISS